MPSVSSWARPLTATQGRRCSGTPTMAVSRTRAFGSPCPSTTTSARAPASFARRRASESGVSDSTGTARLVSVRASSSGRCSRSRAMRRLLPAPVQMIAARIAASSASVTVSMPPMSSVALPRRAGVGEQRQADQDRDGERPAHPGRGDGARHRLAGDLPHDGAQHPAAVQRQTGQQIERGDDQVGDHQAGEQHARDRTGLDGLHPQVEETGQDEREQRPDEGQDELAARRLGFLLDLRDPAEELELDAAHRQFEAQRGDGVGQFVDEYGGVEGDREEEGDEIAHAAELGQHPVELTAEDPGDEGRDDEPAGGDIDGHAEGTAHQNAAAGAVGASRLAAVGVRSSRSGLRSLALTARVVLVHGFLSLRLRRSLDPAVRRV